MKIAEVIARENLFSHEETAILKEDIRRYLTNSMAAANEVLASRASGKVTPLQLHSLLRQREREENTCQILQYLLMYLDSLDKSVSAPPEPAAVKQLEEFVKFQVDILTRSDVRTAILSEFKRLGFVSPEYGWIYERRIDDIHQELCTAFAPGAGYGQEVVRQLCRILELLSLFWFNICREDFRRVRESDLYIYKLALLVQHSPEPPPRP